MTNAELVAIPIVVLNRERKGGKICPPI